VFASQLIGEWNAIAFIRQERLPLGRKETKFGLRPGADFRQKNKIKSMLFRPCNYYRVVYCSADKGFAKLQCKLSGSRLPSALSKLIMQSQRVAKLRLIDLCLE